MDRRKWKRAGRRRMGAAMAMAAVMVWLPLFPVRGQTGMTEAETVKTEASETGAAEGLTPDLTEIDSFLEEQNTGFSFSQLVEELTAGSWQQVPRILLEQGGELLFSEINQNRKELFFLFALAAVSGIFTNFASVFRSGQIAQTGFYVTCLVLTATLLSAFAAASSVAQDFLELLLRFMTVLIPAFFLAVAYGGGSISSAGFYQTTLLAISGVEWIFLDVLLPFVKIYLILVLVNEIAGEDLLSRMARLVKKGTGWGMKSLFSVILGLQAIQGLILPYADSVKTGAVKKVAGLIPGVGKGIDAVAEVMMGSGVLIKNGIGTAAFLCLVLISLVPLLKLAVISVMYQLAAAVLAPVADKRMLRCIDAMAAAVGILLKMSAMAMLMFGVSIALVCSVTNARYFGG